MPKPIRFWLVSFSCVLLLGGCAGNDRETYSQQSFQQMVNAGFLSPQIRSLDLLPIMMVQIYLETPQLFIQGDGEPLMFHINGQVEADVLGGMVTDKLPVQITGVAQLKYAPEDQAIYFDQIDFMEARIDLKVALFKTIIIDRFQQALLTELANMPLIALENTPELASVLEVLAKKGEVQFESRDGNLVVEAVPERK
ncbi:hypothetical protein [Endozoicomonas sp.]|uniref:hypothetical protein n=1 Tax=Endozoicomonas sp. TaxID=1892382 RepID=UPI00288526D5|nr:hypothetical protein [Endozoicomonas sp.]